MVSHSREKTRPCCTKKKRDRTTRVMKTSKTDVACVTNKLAKSVPNIRVAGCGMRAAGCGDAGLRAAGCGMRGCGAAGCGMRDAGMRGCGLRDAGCGDAGMRGCGDAGTSPSFPLNFPAHLMH